MLAMLKSKYRRILGVEIIPYESMGLNLAERLQNTQHPRSLTRGSVIGRRHCASKRAFMPCMYSTSSIQPATHAAIMRTIVKIVLASYALFANVIADKNCVVRLFSLSSTAYLTATQAKAQTSCEAEILPHNSLEARCVKVEHLDWTNPYTRLETQCFCGDEGKRILKDYFDCFYQRAFECPKRSEKFATSYMIWSKFEGQASG